MGLVFVWACKQENKIQHVPDHLTAYQVMFMVKHPIYPCRLSICICKQDIPFHLTLFLAASVEWFRFYKVWHNPCLQWIPILQHSPLKSIPVKVHHETFMGRYYFFFFEPWKQPVVWTSHTYLSVTAATISLDNSDTKRVLAEVELPLLQEWRSCIIPVGLPAHFKLAAEFILC